MDYHGLFQLVQAHLESLQVPCTLSVGRHVIECWDLWDAQHTMKRVLPEELRRFYLAMGDGLSFRWQAEPKDEKSPFANLRVPSLSELGRGYIEWREGVLYSPEAAEKYGFPYTDDPELAKRTAARMWHWLPVLDEGNGDQICLDLASPSCPVIFNQHDWLDGGSGDNGYLMAPSWDAFLQGWASVCFQFPTSLWWRSALKPGGEVAWDGDQFPAPFRLKGLASG